MTSLLLAGLLISSPAKATIKPVSHDVLDDHAPARRGPAAMPTAAVLGRLLRAGGRPGQDGVAHGPVERRVTGSGIRKVGRSFAAMIPSE